MKNIKTGFLAVITIFTISCNNSRPQKNDTKNDLLTEPEVREFINNYDKIWSMRDTIAMKEIMADNYIYFSSIGSTSTKNESISVFNPADKYIVDTAFRDEIKIVLNGNTAIVSSHWVGKGTYETDKFNDNQRCGLVIQKMSSKIKIISEHCVQIVK